MPNPDYAHIGDHTESVQVDFDPKRVSYTELLNIFWSSHRPTGNSWLRQYLNAIFYHNADQQRLAEAAKAAVAAKYAGTIRSESIPVRTFYPAETYHQKYNLKRRPELARELLRIYPDPEAFMDSTAAARLNGYIGGYGSAAQLAWEIDRLGLGPVARQLLLDLVGARSRRRFEQNHIRSQT